MKSIQRILVIGLSNVGDAVLMSPEIEQLHQTFPDARVTLWLGERAEAVFADDPRVQELVCLDDYEGFWGHLRLVQRLRQTRPDLVVDLRHTAWPLLWKPWRCLRYVWPFRSSTRHMRDQHLVTLHRQAGDLVHGMATRAAADLPSLWIAPKDRAAIDTLLARWGVVASKPLVVMCPGARSHIKRWYAERFAAVADRLIDEAGVELILTGEPDESSIAQEIVGVMRQRAHSAVGRTTLRQVAALMQRAALVITNDSASLHVACAVRAPVLALFGPTDPCKYGPTGPADRVLQRRLFCVPCEQAQCRFHHECMRFISTEEVYETARQMLGRGQETWGAGRGEEKNQEV